MNLFISILSSVSAIGALALLFAELRRCLMMLQQNSYRPERYMRWLRSSGDTTSAFRLIAIAVGLISLSTFVYGIVSLILIAIVSVIGLVKLITARYKKPLVMTRRAWRIYALAIVMAVIITGIVFLVLNRESYCDSLTVIAITGIFLYAASHCLILGAVLLLVPVERHINNGYINDARRILESMPDLKIIGITGSYGKTSTKHYLYRILSEKYDTLMTPGSFNTTMGVVRTVREYLKPYNEVFIVEMGAKQPGDIKEICDLVKPVAGIVTAVGPQHLESFKTIENVQRTKFELIDSLPADGIAIANNDFPYIASRRVDNVKISRYAVNSDADYKISRIDYSSSGTRFTLSTPDGQELEFYTHLVGECNVSNLAAAIICALWLDVPIAKIRYAIEHIEQVEHRLNMKRTAGGITIIDDAYNSNPVGSAMALDVLSRMKGGKRIVVTPGMIELGDKQEKFNRKLGYKIAGCADLAIIVNEYNRDAIVAGARDGGMNDDSLLQVASFSEAQAVLARLLSPGDTVLYENDLPDTFK